MAVQGASQALVAAFTFGIVVNAASAALFLFTRGHGSSIFRDGLRLVLITFLLTSALWAQIDFITTVIDTTSGAMSCQVGLIFSTLFDQVGRFAMEQYLLWAMVTPGKASAGGMVTQIFIAVRFIAGGVFVGFTRPQVDTFCVARSSVMPVAFAVIALDGLIIASLAARAFMTGLVADAQSGKASASRSKCILFVMVGFVIWTATSITMMLGMTTMDLIFRTAVPAIGLAILIIIVTACSSELASPRASLSSPPEAPSPRRINISRDISSADSSEYPPSRYEDLKDQAIRSSTAFLQPREAPKAFDDNQRLPNIARPITGVVGMGGLPVRGALFPPTRVETMPLPDTAGKPSTQLKQKRGLFDFGKGSAANVSASKLVIGAPILLDNDAQNPLNKIATIDLKEAARAEQDRRMMALKRESDLVARRPAPQPPNMTPEEALKRSVSVKRKEIASVFSPPAVPSSTLQPVSMSSTTSAQLSPGVEEIRRRSPRQLPADYQDVPAPQRPVSPPMPEAAYAAPIAVEQEQPFVASPVRMRPVSPPEVEKPSNQSPPPQLAVRPGIRPSRKLSSPKKEPPPEPSKTPLQRRPTTGLPPGPRARKLNLEKEAGAQAQQTVMFINNIVYDDPREVQRIIDGANDRASKIAPRPRTPDDSTSVVHRPRPIPRKIEPATEEARKHRRSRSGGSLVSRKSILMSTAGSPTQLPPLPPPPKSAGFPSRPHPNDTKSMTVDEKMGMFFPSPPRSSNATKRKSLVPQLPPLPRAFLESNSSPTEGDDHRRSNRTTKTSVQTDNLFDVDEIPPKPVNTSRFSPETNFAEEVGRGWLPGIADNSFRQTQSTQASSQGGGGKRGSSPVLPIRDSAWTDSTESRTRDTRDGSTTNWDSVYSPEVAVGLQVAPQVARATSIRRVNSQNIKAPRQPSVRDERSSGESIPFVLDSGLEADLRANEPWLSGDETMLRPERASQWHRRVGDDCPSFSARKEKTRSRKMPPPTPLLLNAGSNKNATVVHTAEPSPIESPEQALQQIQAQLKKFEQPNRASVESQGQRLALLENLEKEMGMQENHWHEMQHDLSRNSTSSIGTINSNRNSRRESVMLPVNAVREAPPPPPKANIAQERRALRRSRIRSGSISKADEPAQLPVPANSRAAAWQQKLAMAEAEMEHMDNNSVRGFNFFTVSKAQLGSPTPPDSDQSDEELPVPAVRPAHLDSVVAQAQRGQPQRKLLWVPAATSAHRSSSLLWAPPATKPREVEPALPGLSVRPTQRKESAPLSITSSQLWRKPHHKTRSTTGLWRPSWATSQPTVVDRSSSRPVSVQQSQVQSQQKAPRPVTQRPPRRNKRVTLLPDIIEDPQPLPDKRGTLGIFQFPWGERSDTASVAPVRSTMVMAMPGTMTSGGQTVSAALQARARELESAEYSSSFFDEYDDDDMDVSGDEDEDSGDDFDETTLWEIASLLKTDSIPSKDSLFPPPLASSVVDDYMNDIPSDDEGEPPLGEDSIVIGLSDEQARESVLWQGGPKMPGRGEHGTGLPHPDEATWLKYGAAAVSAAPRVKTRVAEVSVIESDSLWTPEAKEVDNSPAWATASKPTRIPRPSEAKNSRKNRKYHPLGGLWTQPAAKTESGPSHGLFTVDPKRTDYRTTSAEPAAKDMAKKPRPAVRRPLDRLASSSMWTKSGSRKARFQQMSHGMWSPPLRPRQPSESTGLFTVDRSRSDYRTTSLQPAAQAMDRKARPAEHKPLERLTSTSLWSSGTRQVQHHNWITAGNSERRLRRAPASAADWSAALSAALAASYPSKTHRPAATPSDWAAALDSALSLSYRSAATFDASVGHPVFAASSLSTSAAADHVHPAAAGYSYDVGAVHPVFFGSLAVTCPVDCVHPAMVEWAAGEVRKEEEERVESDMLAEQIRQLEEEKMFVARMAGEMYRQRVLPEEDPPEQNKESWTEEEDGRGERETVEVAAEEEEDATVRRQRSRSRREKEERRAQIMAQIRAIEEAAELDTFGGSGANRGEEGGSRKSGVVLRY